MTITDRDVAAIKKAIEIRNRGGYASGQEVTELYNRVLDKHLAPTNCGSCIRTRINELERALRKFETELAKERKEETNGTTTSKGSDERKERKGRSKKATADK